MAAKPLLLTGANGRTGRAILQAMVAQDIPVRAFIRDAKQTDALMALGAKECVVGDMADRDSIAAAVNGARKILHIGPPMHPSELEITQAFISAAKTESIDHFIYYSVMHPLLRDIRHHKLKLEAEQHVVESGVTYTILQPSRYMQHLVPIWQNVIEKGIHAMPFSTKQQFSLVDLEDLAAACAIVAGSNNHFYATYELAGPERLSQDDMATIITDVIGRKITAAAMPPTQVAANAKNAGANDDRVDQMLLMNGHYDAHGFRGNSNILEYLLGRPANSFRSYVSAMHEGKKG